MITYGARPSAALKSVIGNWNLITSLAKRDLSAKYRGSLFGFIWAFATPVLMLLVYTFVFSVVFNARWGENSDSKTEFALVLFIGLIVFNIFAECINQAPGTILSNANYVKKVVFPLEILPVVNLLVACFGACMSLIVWLIAFLIFYGAPSPSVLLAPVILLPFLLMVIGLSWFIASLGVFVRDVSQVVSILVTVAMFMSPIFYPVTALPIEFQPFVALNPLGIVVEQMRVSLFWGGGLNWGLYATELVLGAAVACLGFAWFQKTRKGFADVL